MSLFDGLFMAVADRFPSAIAERLQRAVAGLQRRADRQRKGQAPPIFLSNHLRRDIGLPPVDNHDWPL
jgi:hypothetical protein